jgi:hypothetical protein
MKLLLLPAAFFVLILIGCSTSREFKEPMKMTQLYRDYVLYRCIVLGFDNDSIFLKDATPGVYGDFSGYTIAGGPIGIRLDSLARQKVASLKPIEIPDYEGRKSIFMNCINYYNRKELKRDIKKISKLLKKKPYKTD